MLNPEIEDTLCSLKVGLMPHGSKEIACYLLGCGVNLRFEGIAVEDGIDLEGAGDGDGEDLVAHSPHNALSHTSFAIICRAHERLIADGLDGRDIGPANLGNGRHALMRFGRNFNGDAKSAGDTRFLLREGADGRLARGRIRRNAYCVSSKQIGMDMPWDAFRRISRMNARR
jgi:hypothetical protein